MVDYNCVAKRSQPVRVLVDFIDVFILGKEKRP